jgi:hypothetical protein
VTDSNLAFKLRFRFYSWKNSPASFEPSSHPNLPPERSKLTAAFHHLEVQLTKYFTGKKAA